tara:strand:+ start:3977 stop:4798 length:822 start_codon:yes stop_codon:yes gene_type:complete
MSEEMTTPEQVTPDQSATLMGSVEGSDNQDWKSSLPDELKNDATLSNFKDIESLAKTVVHQQKVLGSRIPLPKTDEERSELYTKLGRPETADAYEFSISEDMKPYFKDQAVSEFKNVAHKIGLNNEQVNALIEYQKGSIASELENSDSYLEVSRQNTEQSLKQEWGMQYDKQIRSAQRALSVYGDPEIMELMNGEAGNNPAVIKLFARLGAEVTEDMTQNTQNNNLAVSALDARQEIESVMGNPTGPYFNDRHPEHKATVERMRQLHEKVFGS